MKTIMLATVLLASTVEAAEFSDLIRQHKLMNADLDTLVTCDEPITKCWTPCEERLREAVELVLTALNEPHGEIYADEENIGRHVAVLDEEGYQAIVQMKKECVP